MLLRIPRCDFGHTQKETRLQGEDLQSAQQELQRPLVSKRKILQAALVWHGWPESAVKFTAGTRNARTLMAGCSLPLETGLERSPLCLSKAFSEAHTLVQIKPHQMPSILD